jgi:2,4-dienoyl-CoA reductase-like NADH-dependent reductase (Old Yellow Enzyme family)
MEGTAFVSNNLDGDRYWRGFRRGDWCHSIAVRDFIVRNVSPYEGDETFLVGPSKRTKAVWEKLLVAQHLRPKFRRALIAAGGFTKESAEAILEAGDADLVAFGRSFVSNPDLPERFRRGWPLNPYDRSTFYGGDARGYIDYPAFGLAAVA